MQLQKAILFTSLILIIIGLPILIFWEKYAIPEPSASNVEFKGTITQVQEHNGVTRLTITPTPPIPIVLFNTKQDLKKGQTIYLTGKIQDYKGKPELVAEVK